MTCREFFTLHGEADSVCDELRKFPNENLVAWEDETASEFSPGAVQADEILYRQVFIPHQYDPAKNCPKPDAYNDAYSFGLSVNRIEHTSEAEIIERGKVKASFDNQDPSKTKNGQRELKGVCTLEVGELRAVLSAPEQHRTFVVYDTARKDDVSHADILYVGDPGRAAWRSMRSFLYDMGVKTFTAI